MTERVFAPSGPLIYTPWHAPERPFGGDPCVDEPRSQTGKVSRISERSTMPGRPHGRESDRRRHEFLRVLSSTGSFAEAIEQSGMSTKRLPKILDEQTFRQVCVAIMDGVAPNPLAVVVEPSVEAQAA